MIQGLAFSKDRALQLDALLSSLQRSTLGLARLDLTILFRATTPRYSRQYEELSRTYMPSVQFVAETDFREQVLAFLAAVRAAAGATKYSDERSAATAESIGDTKVRGEAYILFLVDDAIFVQTFDPVAAQATLAAYEQALGVSLRLGKNTVTSYAFSRRQKLPAFRSANEHFLMYNWTRADGDFGYPLEISSSLYRLSDLLPLLSELEFRDPNTLESQLALQAKRFVKRRPMLLCPPSSIAFSAPINRVQSVFENRSGGDPRWTIDQLAESFDQGLRIDVARLGRFVPTACHEEVEFSLAPRT